MYRSCCWFHFNFLSNFPLLSFTIACTSVSQDCICLAFSVKPCSVCNCTTVWVYFWSSILILFSQYIHGKFEQRAFGCFWISLTYWSWCWLCQLEKQSCRLCYHACTSEMFSDVPAIKLQYCKDWTNFLWKNTFMKTRMLHKKEFHPIENCNALKSCENDSTIHKRLFLLTRMALLFVEVRY